MKQLLFLHENQSFLDRIKSHFENKKSEWEMFFYTDPNKAFAILENNSVDIIVSDLRESSKYGSTFLSLVSQYFPNIIRFVITDKEDQNKVLSSVRPSHQFIYEPTSTIELGDRLDNVLNAQSYVANKKLLNKVTNIDSLPSLPTLYMEVTNEINKENYELTKIAEIISKDIAMTAELLKIVNSPYFGIRKEVKNIHEMVMFLGTDYVKNIILAAKLFKMARAENATLIQSIFKMSEKVAGMAKYLCESQDETKDLVSSCYLAGMMQNLGMLIFLKMNESLYGDINTIKKENLTEIYHLERREFDQTHDGVGAYLLALWGFNFPSCNAIAYRNCPSKSETKSKVLFYLHVANVYTNTIELDQEFIKSVNREKIMPKLEELANNYLEET